MKVNDEFRGLIMTHDRLFEFMAGDSLNGFNEWDISHPGDAWKSPAHWRLLGFEEGPQAPSEKEWQDVINGEDLMAALDNFSRHLDDPNHPYDQVVRYKNREGATVWVRGRACAVRDAQGKPVRVYGVHQDISALKRPETTPYRDNPEIPEGEELYRLIANSTSDSIWVMDSDLRFRYLSPSTEALFGYSLDEWQTLDWNLFVRPGHIEKVNATFAQLKSGKDKKINPVSVVVKHKNGTEMWVEFLANPVFDHAGAFAGAVGITRDITEAKRMEAELEESLERLQALHNASFGGIAIHDKGIILECNQGLAEISGYSTGELTGMDGLLLIAPESREMVMNHILTGFERPYEAQGLRKDGTVYPLRLEARNIPYKGKRVRSVEFRDITESKQAEEALRQSEERFLLAMHASNDGLFDWNLERGEIYYSRGWKLMLGYDEDELPDDLTTWEKNTHPDDLPRCQDLHHQLLSKQIDRFVLEFKMRHKKGHWVDILSRAEAVFDSSGKAVRIVGTHTDISAQKQNERLLHEKGEEIEVQNEELNLANQELLAAKIKAEESERQYRQLFENMEQGFAVHEMIYDGDGKPVDYRFLLINKAFERLTGVEASRFLNKTVREVLPQLEQTWIENYGRVAQTGVPLHFENYSKELDKYYDVIAYAPKKDFFAVVFTDVTQSKTYEQELRMARDKAEESDRLKSAFLANMSHEIRTPMNGILGFAELLKEPGLSGEEQSAYIGIIERSGNRMLNIINNIIDISRIEAGLMNPEPTESNINEQIEYLHNFFRPEADAKKLTLTRVTPLSATDATILTDREKVYAILTNLVKNALKYTHTGGIEFGYTVRQGPGGHTLEFFVKDTGIGIPSNRLEAIFERFIQADIADKMAYEGAGLGLSIARAYAEMLGGRIWVESREGKGSEFYFELPYKPVHGCEIPDQVPVSAGDPALSGRLGILIAEDEEASMLLLSRYVNRFGRKILKASTGAEAVDLCRQHPDLDLVFMDIKMPEMGGYEATRQIRSFNKEVVIIAQTAYGLTGDREKAMEAGCNDYISKPMSKKDLHALMQKHFSRQ